MKTVIRTTCAILASIFLLAGPHLTLGGDGSVQQKLKPAKAGMCESIQQSGPVNQAAVFSIELGRVACFTEFDQVLQHTVVHHKWYRKDNLIAVKRLSVAPDRRFSSSSMQLRDADKGPWRVDVTDADDNLLATLRFSITD